MELKLQQFCSRLLSLLQSQIPQAGLSAGFKWSLASSAHGQSKPLSTPSRPAVTTGFLHRAHHKKRRTTPIHRGLSRIIPEFLMAWEDPPYLLILNKGTSHSWGELMRNKTFTPPLQGTPRQLSGRMEQELPKFSDTLQKPRK